MSVASPSKAIEYSVSHQRQVPGIEYLLCKLLQPFSDLRRKHCRNESASVT